MFVFLKLTFYDQRLIYSYLDYSWECYSFSSSHPLPGSFYQGDDCELNCSKFSLFSEFRHHRTLYTQTSHSSVPRNQPQNLWSDLGMWGHFLIVLNLRNLNRTRQCALGPILGPTLYPWCLGSNARCLRPLFASTEPASGACHCCI